jgi:hypothetical protein
MKKRRGFATVELPLVLAMFGLLLIALSLPFRRTVPVLGWFLSGVGIVFCLPLLAFLMLILLSRK